MRPKRTARNQATIEDAMGGVTMRNNDYEYDPGVLSPLALAKTALAGLQSGNLFYMVMSLLVILFLTGVLRHGSAGLVNKDGLCQDSNNVTWLEVNPASLKAGCFLNKLGNWIGVTDPGQSYYNEQGE